MSVPSIIDKVPRRAVMVRGKAALSFSIQIDAVQAAVGWGRERILVVLDVFLFEIRMWRMCVSLSLRLQKMYKFVIIHFLRGGRCAPPQPPPSIWIFQGQDDSTVDSNIRSLRSEWAWNIFFRISWKTSDFQSAVFCTTRMQTVTTQSLIL